MHQKMVYGLENQISRLLRPVGFNTHTLNSNSSTPWHNHFSALERTKKGTTKPTNTHILKCVEQKPANNNDNNSVLQCGKTFAVHDIQ